MNRVDVRRYEMLIRVRNFGAVHGQLFPTTSRAHAAFDVVAAEIERLRALDVAEGNATHEARAGQQMAAHRTLAETLTRAASTAEVLARVHPTLAGLVRPPLPKAPQPLLTLARQLVTAATPYAAEFVEHDMPLDALSGRITALEQALHDRVTRRDDKVKARAEKEESFQRALAAVATLDVTVSNCLGSDRVTQRVWKQDRRVTYRKARPADPEAPPASADAPVQETMVPPAVAA